MKSICSLSAVLSLLFGCTVASAEDLGSLLKEMEALKKRQEVISNQAKEQFEALLPKGSQSYGDFKWTCTMGGFISVSASDASGKQKVWAQVFYYPELSDAVKNGFTAKCAGFPAKRMKDKWAWVLVGRTEIRFGLSDPALESDATIEAIVKSFDLEKIKAL